MSTFNVGSNSAKNQTIASAKSEFEMQMEAADQ